MTTLCCSISTVRREDNSEHAFVRINQVCTRYKRGQKITDDTWVEVTVTRRTILWQAMQRIKNGNM